VALALDIFSSSLYVILAVVFGFLAVRFYSARKRSKDPAMTALLVLMLGIFLDTVYWGVSTFYRFFATESYARQLLLSIRVDPLLWVFPKLCVLFGALYVVYTMRRIRESASS